MNEITPPNIPPQIHPTAEPAPGQTPEEREPITSPVTVAEAILRQPRRVLYHLRGPAASRLVAFMVLIALACAIVYGLVVGAFSMGDQLWAAPAKIALGMLISAVICLPSLYIFGCLSGSQARFAEVCGLVSGMLLLMTVLLVGFAPVAWLFSQSTESITWMGALHLLFLFIAISFGLRFLKSGFMHTQARSSAGLNTWILVFVLVVLQMTTALRPLVGKADTFLPKEKKFFVAHWADSMRAAAKAPDRNARDTRPTQE